MGHVDVMHISRLGGEPGVARFTSTVIVVAPEGHCHSTNCHARVMINETRTAVGHAALPHPRGKYTSA